MMNTETNHALENAKSWMESIESMLFAADENNWDRLEELKDSLEDDRVIPEYDDLVISLVRFRVLVGSGAPCGH